MAVAIIPHRTLFCSKEIFKYNRHNLLGHGSYSHVFHGTFRFNEVAMKRLVSTPSLTEDEVKHHKRLNRENVLELLAVIDTNNFRFMVLELCSGSLFQVIQNTYDGPALPSDREVMYQIAAGLNYVHSQNLVHLDIKPENILISTNGQMKLSDFGLCMETKRGVCILNGSVRGTYSWMAPEVFPRDSSNMNKVSAMADVFSCGCVFLVFLSREDGGIHPFGDRNSHHETIQNNIREGNQVNMAALGRLPFANVVLPMIANGPENRGSLEELMAHL